MGECLARLHVSSGTRVCVGLSGGLDSVVLLHLLAQWRATHGFFLSAVHVHHGLSPNADAWGEAARGLATALGVPCRVERVRVDARVLGIEAAARAARYAAFESLDAEVLCLGHHRDDQAETVLMNALRGNGLGGLAAMPECRALTPALQLLRPLLDVPRSVLRDYADLHALTWVDDESNADTRFTRNFLRHQILPPLLQRDPGVVASLARLAGQAAEADALLCDLAELDLATCVVDGAFDLAVSAGLSERRRRNALRHWLAGVGIVADARAFDAFVLQLGAAADAQPELRWRSRRVRRYRQRLYPVPAVRFDLVIDVEPGVTVETPLGRLAWVRGEGIAESAAGRWQLRPRTGGERLRLRADGPTRPLKQLYQEAGVPPWLREAMPLLYCDETLAAVPGVGIAIEFKGEGWLPLWQPA
ncbi:tRNA lysidine(34) synthetase TilS [Jeongeupia sp. USM3]|uniref:tRNA lysidine(34) synthetase TilS n=1 Tax=Jeongeupia sp. USM3 TaxID=1906741 RepID=UPI000AD11E4A|nr:tRNA lysidine(34) synthetase TilS [Jeongeupia sp. USM3]